MRGCFVADVASFFLPYVEQAVDFDPTIRMVCLSRPADEVVAGFLAALNRNHCAPRRPSGRTAAARRSNTTCSGRRTFPKYDVADREAGSGGIGRIIMRYPRRSADAFRNSSASSTPSGSRPKRCPGGTTFCGFPWSDSGRRHGETSDRKTPHRPRASSLSVPRPAGSAPWCVVLVPFAGFIHHRLRQALKQLERRGYQVRRVGGYAAVDQARNQMATHGEACSKFRGNALDRLPMSSSIRMTWSSFDDETYRSSAGSIPKKGRSPSPVR